MEAPSESCQHVAEPSSVGKLGWNVVGRLLPGPPSLRPLPWAEPPATLHGGSLTRPELLGNWVERRGLRGEHWSQGTMRRAEQTQRGPQAGAPQPGSDPETHPVRQPCCMLGGWGIGSPRGQRPGVAAIQRERGWEVMQGAWTHSLVQRAACLFVGLSWFLGGTELCQGKGEGRAVPPEPPCDPIVFTACLFVFWQKARVPGLMAASEQATTCCPYGSESGSISGWWADEEA